MFFFFKSIEHSLSTEARIMSETKSDIAGPIGNPLVQPSLEF